MKFPIKKEDMNGFVVENEWMNSRSPWCVDMSRDEMIERVFTVSEKNEIDFSCRAYFFVDYFEEIISNNGELSDLDYQRDDIDVLLLINLDWNKQQGFMATVCVDDLEGAYDSYAVNLGLIPTKTYVKQRFYDFDALVEKGIELFNEYFDFETYQKKQQI